MTKWCENHFPFMATPLLTLFQFVKVGENTESNYSETISAICAACWPLHPSNKNVLNFEHPAVRASMMQTPVRIACHHARKIANECGGRVDRLIAANYEVNPTITGAKTGLDIFNEVAIEILIGCAFYDLKDAEQGLQNLIPQHQRWEIVSHFLKERGSLISSFKNSSNWRTTLAKRFHSEAFLSGLGPEAQGNRISSLLTLMNGGRALTMKQNRLDKRQIGVDIHCLNTYMTQLKYRAESSERRLDELERQNHSQLYLINKLTQDVKFLLNVVNIRGEKKRLRSTSVSSSLANSTSPHSSPKESDTDSSSDSEASSDSETNTDFESNE